jgi:hypothetical protein
MLVALCNARGIITRLIDVLSDNDYAQVEEKNIMFNGMYAPSSVTNITSDIPIGSSLISIELVLLRKLSGDECVAIILHEIGHVLDPMIDKYTTSHKDRTTKEFVADDYAFDRAMGENIERSIPKMKDIYGSIYTEDGEINKERIIRLADKRRQSEDNIGGP